MSINKLSHKSRNEEMSNWKTEQDSFQEHNNSTAKPELPLSSSGKIICIIFK